MFLVAVELRLGNGRHLSNDEISDLLSALVDDLDLLEVEPSAGTRRLADGDVEMTLELLVDERDELDALASALAAARSSLERVGVVATHDVRSRVVPQPA